MTQTIIELLGKLGKLYSTEKNRGFYLIDTINENEIKLLRSHIDFESFDFGKNLIGDTPKDKIRFYINLKKESKKK